MKPGQLMNALKKRLWLIVLLTVVAALAGALVSRIQTPVYKVEITLAAIAPINPVTKQPDATISIVYQQLMPTIALACENPDIAKKVRERLAKSDIQLSEEELLKKMSAGPVANTNSLRITVTDRIPYRVKEIANAWGIVCAQQLSKAPVLLYGTLNLVKSASQPEKPTQPKPTVYTGLGAFLGIVISVSLAIAIEYFNPHFRSPEEVEEMIGLEVVGAIPKKATESALREAYSTVRTGILFSREPDAGNRSILLAGAIPVKGTHDVSINLAKSMSDAGRRVLLVDCDMRNKVVSSLMGASHLPGLADFLERNGQLKGKIAITNFPRLFLLPAGSASDSPANLLSQPKFEALIRELENEFDAVVLDAPTLIEAVDATIIATYADKSLVVIDIKSCTRNIVLQALDVFERLHIKPDGLILTNVKMKGAYPGR